MSNKFRSRKSAELVLFDDRREDPLSKILQPPADETPEERAERLVKQQEALRISREIDESILESKKVFDKRKKAVKVLLLGQAESGKSTTLKNFQLAFAPSTFLRDRAAWKTIIQLNLIGSIKKLLDVLSSELEVQDSKISPSSSLSSSAARGASDQPVLTDNHRRIRMRLSPLLSIETSLARKLLPDSPNAGVRELCVRAGSGWKAMLERVTSPPPKLPDGKGRSYRPTTSDDKSREDPTTVLSACKEDIITLWEDPVMKALLKKRNTRLDLAPGFFLNDTVRIADLNYEPTNSDVVRARLRTYGVEEHRMIMENGAQPGADWIFYDVGGSRFMRPHWVPYFDDVQAIIFLAPLAFNLVLDEDSKVNRLQDSIQLWQEVCSSPLLALSNLILFLNKMDILKANLDAGILVKSFVPSYGSNPNDIVHVTKYFKDKFHQYLKRLSPKPRPFFCHETSVIDTHATRAILVGVQEGILRGHLQKTSII